MTPAPSHGGPGTHLIAPGIVPALTSWPLPGQPTSPAWKNPHQSRCICLWRVENGRGGRGSHGAVVPLHCAQPLILQGQTQETQQSLGPILFSDSASLGGGVTDAAQSWWHLAPFLAQLAVWGWAQTGSHLVSIPDTSPWSAGLWNNFPCPSHMMSITHDVPHT